MARIRAARKEERACPEFAAIGRAVHAQWRHGIKDPVAIDTEVKNIVLYRAVSPGPVLCACINGNEEEAQKYEEGFHRNEYTPFSRKPHPYFMTAIAFVVWE